MDGLNQYLTWTKKIPFRMIMVGGGWLYRVIAYNYEILNIEILLQTIHTERVSQCDIICKITQLRLKFAQIFCGWKWDRIILYHKLDDNLSYQRICFLRIGKLDKSIFLKIICSCENKGSFVTFPTFGYN